MYVTTLCLVYHVIVRIKKMGNVTALEVSVLSA